MKYFHTLPYNINNEPVPNEFTNPFDYEVDKFSKAASCEVIKYIESRREWHEELLRGKMFGVLVVRNLENQLGFIAAFSGAQASSNSHSYFVPPIFDILTPDGEYKNREAEISKLNVKINELENSNELRILKARLEDEMARGELELAGYRELSKVAKARREELRKNGENLSLELKDGMQKESQFEKAELKRIKLRIANQVNVLREDINPIQEQLDRLKNLRRSMSVELQRWLFDQYVLLNARGERKTIREIFEQNVQKVPPSATGECAAPKLLQWAYLNELEPISMAEFWYGKSPVGEVRHHLSFYPACKSKCKPILEFMLEGLQVNKGAHLQSSTTKEVTILFEDKDLLVVDKPEGVLSVRGRCEELTVEDYLVEMGYNSDELFVVHRLDMATSGVLMVARSREIFIEMQRQFAKREVVKEYEALLEREPKANKGWINLPLSADYANRPCQMVDFESGKEAKTRYEVLSGDENSGVRIRLYPVTGRTHQLRMHTAYCYEEGGLGSPILGDRLYGERHWQRMCLHSAKLEFRHPSSKELLVVESAVPF